MTMRNSKKKFGVVSDMRGEGKIVVQIVGNETDLFINVYAHK